jgi:hypothetical protein
MESGIAYSGNCNQWATYSKPDYEVQVPLQVLDYVLYEVTTYQWGRTTSTFHTFVQSSFMQA